MLQEVAVEHVWRVRVGVAGEGQEEPDRRPRRDVDRVLPASQRGRRATTVDVDDMELHAVDVEVVRGVAGVGDLPHLGLPGRDDVVDAVHVHVQTVDVRAAESERPDHTGVRRVEVGGRGEVLREVRAGAEAVGGTQLEDVEAVVPAGEPLVPEVGAQVRVVAAEDDVPPWLQADHDLDALPG
ncbi:hypothetical protein FHR93_003637 [Geodermatophilus sabuli]|nr:hypothetical protein [Geodermatophilus sabuli]MBB3085410.1 hypothetical protein [Geodermatophilus sabuli]